jgi:hypothetical protein
MKVFMVDPDDSMGTQILAQEHRAIELLARETHSSIAKVQEIFLSEYVKIAPNAHITAFLPLLTSNRVRAILDAANEANEHSPTVQP